MNWRSVTLLLVVAFAAGAVGFAWLESKGSMAWMETKTEAKSVPAEPDMPPTITAFTTPPVIQPSASQAEALLLISNARRSIEGGKPLGDLGSRLQLTFGQTQPQALAVIANGIKQPVSNAALLAEFDVLAPTLAAPNGTAWDRMQYEMSTLFVLRSPDAKPAVAATRNAEIRKLIIAGDIAGAVKLVRAMPGAANGADWLSKANKAIAVHAALDALNQSALLPPPSLVPPTGTDTAPVAPSPSQIPAAPSDGE